MIIENTQQNVVINLDTSVQNIAVKISGGADSAILTYILALYKRDYRPDITINTITGISSLKKYQQIFSDQVLHKITDLTGVEFGKRFVFDVDSNDYINGQFQYTEKLKVAEKLDAIFVGETKNPPLDNINLPHLTEGRPGNRDGENMPTRDGKGYMPFKNINKQGIYQLYVKLGVLEELFPLTRSCEEFTTDFSKHCEHCWFCKERYWGFGRFV